MSLKLTIVIAVIPLMVLAGIYTYRFLNNKLMSSRSTWGLIFYSLALLLSIAGIYGGGMVVIALMYDYLLI